jgi:hypothetical protein
MWYTAHPYGRLKLPSKITRKIWLDFNHFFLIFLIINAKEYKIFLPPTQTQGCYVNTPPELNSALSRVNIKR